MFGTVICGTDGGSQSHGATFNNVALRLVLYRCCEDCMRLVSVEKDYSWLQRSWLQNTRQCLYSRHHTNM